MSHCGPHSIASLDGEIMPAGEATIPVTDDGLVRGDGAFEVIRVYDGAPFAMDEHLTRLERSGRNLRLPIDVETVRTEAYKLLAEASANPGDPADHAQLRIMMTRGGRRVMFTERTPEMPERARLLATPYLPTRVLDAVKSLSYAANMLAARLAREAGYDDALLVTPDGVVLEATTSSIFWVRGGQLETTPLDEHVLASITRATILEVAEVRECVITLPELYEVQEAFLASTAREVHSISAVDDTEFPGPGPVTESTASAVAERIHARLRG